MSEAIELKAKQFLTQQGYTIQELLGKGSFGIVYKAHDFSNNRQVAIKALIPNYTSVSSILENLLKSFKEIQNCQSLNSENVVKIYNSYIDEEIFVIFIVQEFCSRGNLSKYMQGFKNPSENALKNIIMQILKGMTDIHDKSIIHSDIKPENILVDSNETIKIADFGEAKQLQHNKNQTQAIGASPIYAAPEVNNQGVISNQSDYYSVGAVICIICGLGFEQLKQIQQGCLPDVRNHKFKYLLLLAFNMMSFKPDKRASCQKVYQILSQTNSTNNEHTNKILQELSTQCNQEALNQLKNNYQGHLQQANQNNLIPVNMQELKWKRLYQFYWIIWIILPLILAGISIYFMTLSCSIFQHLVYVVICLMLSYFSATSFFTVLFDQKLSKSNSIMEFFLNVIFMVAGIFISILIGSNYPCNTLRVCTSFFDINSSKFLYQPTETQTEQNSLHDICKMQNPQRINQLEQYLQQRYSPEIEITHYFEIDYWQILYVIINTLMSIWILVKIMQNLSSLKNRFCK